MNHFNKLFFSWRVVKSDSVVNRYVISCSEYWRPTETLKCLETNVGLFVPSQDVTEEDIDSELAVIHSQMAYIMQLQGRTDEALQLYNQVIKLK